MVPVDQVADFSGSQIIDADSIQAAIEMLKSNIADEKAIRQAAVELEEKYFDDMTLRVYKFLHDYAVIENGNEWVKKYDNGYRKKIDITISRDWIFRIDDDMKPEKCCGYCDDENKTIKVRSKFKNDTVTLAHELTHAYESMLPERYRQFLTATLYCKLLVHIPGLINKIALDAHSMLAAHNTLFLLKSLDLDIRLNKPLGTVYGYDREKILF